MEEAHPPCLSLSALVMRLTYSGIPGSLDDAQDDEEQQGPRFPEMNAVPAFWFQAVSQKLWSGRFVDSCVALMMNPADVC